MRGKISWSKMCLWKKMTNIRYASGAEKIRKEGAGGSSAEESEGKEGNAGRDEEDEEGAGGQQGQYLGQEGQ